MIGFLGLNFCSDKDCLNPTPTDVRDIDYIRAQNGIYDHMNITKNTEFSYTTTIPEDWDFDTIFNADFNGDISGGNVDQIAANITEVRIKRRIKGTFDWTTIKIIPIEDTSQLSFIINDNIAQNNTEYEYAFVPVTNNVEGQYIIESIMSKFNGVFICDVNTVFKFLEGAEYGPMDATQQIGVFQPFNRPYPVIVSNSVINYQTGSVGCYILPDDFAKTGNLSRPEMTAKRKVLLDFLNNKKPKIIKDFNKNAWLVFFTGNPQTTFENNYGMGIAKVTASWTEIGDVNSKNDLYEAGMIPTED